MTFQRNIGQIQPVIVPPTPAEVNTGPAEAIKAVGDGIVGTYSGLEQGALRDKITAEIEGYIQTDESSAQALQELPDAAVNEALLAEQTSADEEEARFFADPVVSEARQRTSKLSSAVKAGSMSSSELKVRVQALTREYINRAPGLAQHFRRVASETLGDYDAVIDSVADQAKAQKKSTEFVRKQTYSQAQKLHIDITQPYSVITQQVNEIIPHVQRADEVARQVALMEGDKKLQDNTRRDGFASFSKGRYHVAVGQAAGIAQGEGSKEQKIHALNQLKGNYAQLMGDFAGNSMKPDEVSGRIAPAIAQIDEYIKVVNNERELGLVQRENQLAMQIAESDYFNKDPRAREMAVLVKQWGIKIDASNVKGMIGTLEQVVRVINGGSVLDTSSPKTPEGREKIKNYYKAASDILEDFTKNPDTKVTADDMNNIMQGPIRQFDPFKMSNEELDGLMNFMSRNDAVAAVNKLSEQDRIDTLQPMAAQFDRFLEDRWAPNLNKDIEDVLSSRLGRTPTCRGLNQRQAGEARGFISAPTVDDNGRMVFSASEEASSLPTSEQRKLLQGINTLNSRYASRFNTLVKARAHLEGSTEYGKWGQILFNQLSGEK